MSFPNSDMASHDPDFDVSIGTITIRRYVTDGDQEGYSNEITINVNALPSKDPENIKNLLIEQIEKPVRWRESIINMINTGNKKFVEIGPGKVLSGLIKRIDRNVELIQVNNISDVKSL